MIILNITLENNHLIFLGFIPVFYEIKSKIIFGINILTS